MSKIFLSLFIAVFLVFSGDYASAADLVRPPFAITYGTADKINELMKNPDDKQAIMNAMGINSDLQLNTLLDAIRSPSGYQVSRIETGIQYWAERMAGAKQGVPAPLDIFFVDAPNPDPNIGAFSQSTSVIPSLSTSGVSANGAVYDALVKGRQPGWLAGTPYNIIAFFNDPAFPADLQEPRLLLPGQNLTSVMMHEMGHALGMIGFLDIDPGGQTGSFNSDMMTAWSSHLYDVFGERVQPDGMPITMITTGTPNNVDSPEKNDGIFQVYGGSGNDPEKFKYPTFHGTYVDALTGGAGMPVTGVNPYNTTGELDNVAALIHSGLMQSTMSYGIINNMPFTEMELAMFQDLGYTIDRRKFFGKSYYYEVGGNTQINQLGFGTAAAPNTATFGLGTHIMRDGLNLTQAADIYAGGYGAGGIRIDGVGNSLTIPQGVTVAADGQMGTGLLVSYGSGNEINLSGTVSAAGPGGIGAHFGILAYHSGVHSYMDTPLLDPTLIQHQHEYGVAAADLAGPLVKSFDIYGTLQGSKTGAAIRIESDAHVEEVIFHSGSVVTGDIVSEWRRDPATMDYGTTLTFGETGKGGGMALTGNILWPDSNNPQENSLDVVQEGGRLSYHGTADVASWNIKDGATLSGSSTITVNGGTGTLVNSGTIAPGAADAVGAIHIVGDYKQTGTLMLGLTSAGNDNDSFNDSDSFTVTDNTPAITGSLVITPKKAFYASEGEYRYNEAKLFGSTLSLSDFPTKSLAFNSPTLLGTAEFDGSEIILTTGRQANAYSRHASGATTAGIGNTLLAISRKARGDMRNLFTALDFSSPDGSTVRSAMEQLSPVIYDNLARSSFASGRVLAAGIFSELQADAIAVDYGNQTGVSAGDGPADGPRAFVLPQGGVARQKSQGDHIGYDAYGVGLLGGLNWDFDAGSAGFHLSYEHRRLDADNSARSDIDALSVGAQAAFRPGSGFFAYGLVNLGLESSRVTRPMNFNGYIQESRKDFTAWTALAATRAGWEWQAGDWRFGPLAGLEYGGYFRPSVTESGGGAANLHLESDDFHSLRTALGAQARVNIQTQANLDVQAGLSAEWKHETLDLSTGSRASFVDYRDDVFQVKNRDDGRDALALRGTVSLTTDSGLRVGAFAGTELFQSGYSDVQGGFSLSWDF